MDSRCPLRLKSLPCKGCPLGENLFKTPVKKHKRCSCKNPEVYDFSTMICDICDLPLLTCHWGINSEEDNYCLWVYLSQDKGMIPITDTQISEFIDLTVQRVGQIKTQAINFLYEMHGNSMKKFLISDPF